MGKTGAGSVVTGAEALAALLAAGVVIPAAGAGAVALEAGIATGLTGTGDREVPDAAGVTDTVAGVAVTAVGAWPAGGAVDWRGGLALAVGVA